jgi:hypothetical protein
MYVMLILVHLSQPQTSKQVGAPSNASMNKLGLWKYFALEIPRKIRQIVLEVWTVQSRYRYEERGYRNPRRGMVIKIFWRLGLLMSTDPLLQETYKFL